MTEKSPKPSRVPQGVATNADMRGRGPAKGAKNAGRPSNDWRQRMECLRDRGLQAAEARGIVDDPDHPQWLAAIKFCHEATAGKPAQSVKLAGDPDAPVTIRVVRESAPEKE